LRALAPTRLDRSTELDAGRRLEAVFHGTPSGIDPAAAALGTCFRFVRGEPPSVTPLHLTQPLPLVVAFGDRPRSTGAAVGGLRTRWEADRLHHEALFDAVAAVVERGAQAMMAGDLAALGRAFDDNQALLERLGVSSDEVATLVAAARQAGGVGGQDTRRRPGGRRPPPPLRSDGRAGADPRGRLDRARDPRRCGAGALGAAALAQRGRERLDAGLPELGTGLLREARGAAPAAVDLLRVDLVGCE